MVFSSLLRQLRLFGISFLPHRWIKYFPPDFTYRDPMYVPIERSIRKGKRVLLYYIDIYDFRLWKEKLDPVKILAIVERLKRILRRLASRYFLEKEILLFQHFWGDDFLLFVQVDPTSPFHEEEWREKGIQFMKEVSGAAGGDEDEDGFPYPIRFHFAMLPLPDRFESFFDMVHDSIYMAHAMAKRRTSPHHVVSDELKAIISGEKITLMKQPIFYFSGSGLAGYEILIRGPEETAFHKPGDLFQYASEVRLLLSLESIVMKKIFQALDALQSPLPLSAFINITASTLQEEGFYQHILSLLKEFPNVDAKRIFFEITERESIHHMEEFKRAVDRFRALGFRFAVDNAGTGYSSLYVMTEILPEVIKVDRSVIQDIDQNLVKESMLQALLFIAERIGAKVIAEGIETEEEMELLFRNQVEYGQGFLLQPPIPLKERERVGD